MSRPTPLTVGNRRVKEARKLSRRSVRAERRLFLADGPKAVEAAFAYVREGGPGIVREVFATPEALSRFRGLINTADQFGVSVDLVDDRAMAALSESVTPAGIVAVCHFLDVPLDELWHRPAWPLEDVDAPRVEAHAARLVAICAEVRDPGNAGTVIRTADAAGAAGVVLAGDSVDAYNPKTVRASVGSLFHLPVAIDRDPAAAVSAAQDAGLTVLAADGRGEVDLFGADARLERPTAWMFGNEAHGLPDHLLSLADHVIRIPIFGRAESLNLSTAAALCLYASARAQR